jgi:putative selenate reductase
MNPEFKIIPFRQLVQITLNQLDNKRSFFDIPKELFFNPIKENIFRLSRFGQGLETPLGTAAGPHTQMTQNIVVAWLCGARYVELKTIQTLDELKVSKPCIDMQDEGYNCEWSQELKIQESFDQYLNAWILIHILKDKLQHLKEENSGTIFNMSVGYNHEGIMQKNVQWFLSQMKNCSVLKTSKIDEIRDIYPNVENILIPNCISDNVTLSTMHGCPSDEIEKIGLYLIQERKLHTIIKLNPTLLGKEKLSHILKNSGFEITVPDEAYDHDLKYPNAVQIIKNLQTAAELNHVSFGLKLTNTLESLNHKKTFPAKEKTMYISGKLLHPIAINLASKLQNEFNGALDISFSAGVNAFNIHHVVSCGLTPATVCTDLLKPGGYGLLNQYLVNLNNEIKASHSNSITEFILKTSGEKDISKGILTNLNRYANEVRIVKDYKQVKNQAPNIKTERLLGSFDCIQAPCMDVCPTHQEIPDYLHFTAIGDYNAAFKAITRTNPFPNTTGMICDHLCQAKCTRINYDDPLLIREIKRFIAENGSGKSKSEKITRNGRNVAVIGAGPSGISCAHYLNLAGFQVDIFEAACAAGGMVAEAIPSFRLSEDSLNKDLERLLINGVNVFYNTIVDKHQFTLLKQDYDFIYIATGAWSARKFAVEGIHSHGVLDPLIFLSEAKQGKIKEMGKNIAVIGGGNTAMDTARTALRLSGKNGKVTILYRRSKAMMPSDPDEIKAVLDEGISILDLTLPVRVNTRENRVRSLTCVKIKLEQKPGLDKLIPVEIPGSEFDLEFDTVIPAIGQDAVLDFIDEMHLSSEGFESNVQNVFIGGDAHRGGSTVIFAIADGRKTAELIKERAGIFASDRKIDRSNDDFNDLMSKRMRKQRAVTVLETKWNETNPFGLVIKTLSAEDAQKEASRCLNCDELCNICVTVCPNLACFSYQVKPGYFDLQKIQIINSSPAVVNDKVFRVNQNYQILHIADWCNECGNCATFCPTSGAPCKDKPHIYLVRKSFDDCETGYFYDFSTQHLYFKQQSNVFSIKKIKNTYHFKKGSSWVKLDSETFNVKEFEMGDQHTISLYKAAEMSLILAGAKEFWTGTNN